MPDDDATPGAGATLGEGIAFENPHAEDAELAAAFDAGYRDAAFGDHVMDDPPPFPPGSQADAFEEGFDAGTRRFEAYKKGFSRGINLGLRGITADQTPPPFPATALAELAEAWKEGRSDGFRVAQEVRDLIVDKASATEHFDDAAGPIHSRGLPGGERLFWQEWAGNRAIYLERPADVAVAVDAPIYAEYQNLGGLEGFLARPVGDTRRVPDGRGSFHEFEGGTVYATATTGAHEVHGQIRERWLALGGPGGYLGYPTSGELAELADDGRVNTFEHGDIYSWPDTGLVDLRGVQIRYRGLNCFAESSEISSEDEPYVVASAIGPNQQAIVAGVTPVVDANAGGSFPDFREVFAGPPARIGALAVTMMEHDDGDPNEYRAQIEAGVRVAVNAAAGAIAATGVGLPVSGLALFVLNAGAGPIADAINSAIDTGDDLIGTDVFPLAPKALIALARAELQRERDVEFNLATALLTGEGAYKAYFDVEFLEH
jgi:hypothetical protein